MKKLVKFSNLFIAVLAILFLVSCSKDSIETTESEIESTNLQAEAYIPLESDELITFSEEEVAEMAKDFELWLASNSPEVDSSLAHKGEWWNDMPDWAWWWASWNDYGGHTIERHWNMGTGALRRRGLRESTSFMSRYISPTDFSNMMKWIVDNHADGLKRGFRRTLTFDSPPGLANRAVGHGVINSKGTIYTTKKFKVVLAVAASGSVYVLTAYPLL